MSSDPTEEQQTGGGLYDKGAYGCVFLPTLTCTPGTEHKSPAATGETGIRYIDKLMDPDAAYIEYAVGQRVHRIPMWKNYFIVPTSTCTPAPKEQQSEQQLQQCDIIDGNPLQSLRILRMPFGGMPLSHAYLRMNKNGDGLLSFILHLLEAGALLAMFGMVHRDLHQGNILVDGVSVPRIIDFNLAIDVRSGTDRVANLVHEVDYTFFQESPDSCVVGAIYHNKDGFDAIESFLRLRKSLIKVQSLLGITKQEMRDQLQYFLRHSRSAQNGDLAQWFNTYWHTQDSWAIGMNIVMLITDHLLWPSFAHGEYQTYKYRLLPILRDMVNCNPMKRIDCVQALARLDAGNYIIRTYGRKWLDARSGRD